MRKKLITGDTIRELKVKQETSINAYPRSNFLVTPEAYTVAKELKITIIEDETLVPTCTQAIAPKSVLNLREIIVAQLPIEHKNNEALIEQLISKVQTQGGAFTPNSQAQPSTQANNLAATAANNSDLYQSEIAASGVKVVKGQSVNFSLFTGSNNPKSSGKKDSVGVVEVIGAADNSPMAAGFMEWDDCFFPWTLTYDEVSYVIEGELHIRTNGQTLIAKVGDVLFIPKNSSIEFGTPTHVRFLFVAHPASWAD
ncbi:ethanolamine utilization protein EutQ [Gammaproteobacteria bacterium]|nr:ethanolamine utilization protein EutQ [Gammaproteobacteria bacterium]